VAGVLVDGGLANGGRDEPIEVRHGMRQQSSKKSMQGIYLSDQRRESHACVWLGQVQVETVMAAAEAAGELAAGAKLLAERSATFDDAWFARGLATYSVHPSWPVASSAASAQQDDAAASEPSAKRAKG